MHACAGGRFVAVHQVFPLAEGIQEHGHGADIKRVRAQPEQVIEDAGDLVEHDPEVLRARRGFNFKQLLDRAHVGVLVAHHGHVIQPVHVADAVVVGLAFGQFLGAPMQQANVRVDAFHDLAVQFQHQPQDPVGRRVLRPEIHGVVVNLSHGPALAGLSAR